jgi:hypothetical protein
MGIIGGFSSVTKKLTSRCLGKEILSKNQDIQKVAVIH